MLFNFVSTSLSIKTFVIENFLALREICLNRRRSRFKTVCFFSDRTCIQFLQQNSQLNFAIFKTFSAFKDSSNSRQRWLKVRSFAFAFDFALCCTTRASLRATSERGAASPSARAPLPFLLLLSLLAPFTRAFDRFFHKARRQLAA